MDHRENTPEPDRPQPPQYRRAGGTGADDATEVFGAVPGGDGSADDYGTRQFDPVQFDPVQDDRGQRERYGQGPQSTAQYGGRYNGQGYAPQDDRRYPQQSGRPPVPVPTPDPPKRRSIGSVWTAVILVLVAVIVLLFFFLWIGNRGSGGSGAATSTTRPSATVTRTPTQTQEPTSPGIHLPTNLPGLSDLPDLPSDLPDLPDLPTELPDQDQLNQWRDELGDRFNDFMDGLNNRAGN